MVSALMSGAWGASWAKDKNMEVDTVIKCYSLRDSHRNIPPTVGETSRPGSDVSRFGFSWCLQVATSSLCPQRGHLSVHMCPQCLFMKATSQTESWSPNYLGFTFPIGCTFKNNLHKGSHFNMNFRRIQFSTRQVVNHLKP